jgi:Uma2 family endonuclease
MGMSVTYRRFTVDDYHRMAETGILTEDDRVELLDGQVLEMSPIGPAHAGCVNRLTRLFTRLTAGSATVSVQNPVVLSARSEPQPDLAILRYREDGYAAAHPSQGDVLLVVEVADRSSQSDRAVKVPLYAAAGIGEVWLVDLSEGRIEVYRGPAPVGYRQVSRVRSGQSITPLRFPDLTIAANEILG